MEKQLIKPEEFGLEKTKATELMGNLPQIKAEREILTSQYEEIIKLDIEDPITVKKARELRLLIQKNRTQGINVWHKNAKDFFLKGGQFVDAIKRLEISVNENMEEVLESIEKNAERKEAERKEKLKQERLLIIEPYSEFVPLGINLGEIKEEEFTKILNGAKLQFDLKIEQEEKAEEERILNEKAEADERERIKIENARLKAEAEAKEKQLAEERAKAEAILKVEREAKEKLENELRAKKEAEEKVEEERILNEEKRRKEAEKLAKAPIKKQLSVWVNSFQLPIIDLENETSKEIINKFDSFKNWAQKNVDNL